MNPVKDFINNLGFFTVIPVGMRYSSLEEVAKGAYLLPLIGALMGLIAGGAGLLLQKYLPMLIPAGISLFIILYLSGFHHLDGLLDFGDGMVVQGDRDKKIEAMHDLNTGVGGFALGFFILLLTFLALAESKDIFFSMIIAEASAKFSILFGSFFGTSSHEGMGSAFSRELKKNYYVLIFGALIYLAILSYISLYFTVISVAVVIGLTLLILVYSNRNFSGISGDVLGALHEISRLAVLVVLLV